MLSVPFNSFFYLLPVGAINSARLKVCNACCKSTVRTYEWVSEREITLKAWRKNSYGCRCRHCSCSHSRSRRPLQFRTSSFTRRLTQIVHSSSWSSWLYLRPFCSSFFGFFFLLRFFLGISFVQGNLDRSSSSGSDCDCILGAHSSVPHYSPIHPLATQSKAHKYNETQTHTHRHTRFYRLSLFTLGFSNKCFANICGRCFGICYSL